MEPELLEPPLQAAFRALLDDDSPAVRAALAGAFARRGRPAVEFLRGFAHGADPWLARHATWFLQQLNCGDPVAEFTAYIRALDYDLETGALLLSRTVSPALDPAACRARLDELAQRCRELIVEPATARDQCRVVSRVLFHEHGFRGNVECYTDPRNSLLDQVLARRQGLPLTLGLVYLFVAQRLGLTLEPVGLPGHFVVGCFLEDPPFFVDAFARGVFRTPGELFALLRRHQIAPRADDLAPTPVREVLCRCCRNLASHYAAGGDSERARLFAGFVGEFEATRRRHATP
ncbi:MAG TPA: transglutaminase-like domain-containing protein [Opitutaceae bacterium]|nr:transglutaminase-like domain-containing protein [Opitutaceae bacterium]